MKIIMVVLAMVLTSSCLFAAEFIPKKLSQMTDDIGVGTHTADTSNPHGTTTTQTNLTVTTLTVTDSLITGTASISGVVKQNGTATLSGVASPYIAQTGGTGTGNLLTNTTLTNPSVTGSITAGRIYNSSNIILNAITGSGISLRVNDTENAFLNSIGLYVGGSGLPSYPLHVIGTAAVTGNFIQSTGNSYHFFGGTEYGFRDNAGTMQFKNTGGLWVDITGTQTTLAGGWQDDGTTVRVVTVTDKIAIGTTTAAANQIFTVVGSSTVNDIYVGGFLAVGTANSSLIGGTPTVKIAIGDNDTGFGYVSDGIFKVVANSNTMMQFDGNTEKVMLGTTSTNTKFNVGGTVTAQGFSGDGSGLTNISSVNVSGTATVSNLVTNVVTGSATAFCYAYQTGSITVNSGTWTNVALNADINYSYNATHTTTNTEQLKALVPGIYEVSGRIQALINSANVAVRLCKNNGTEIPGSLTQTYMNIGDASTGECVATTPLYVRLATNDYVYMQVAHNQGGGIVLLNYVFTGMPAPGTVTTACLSMKKIGE